eukprot:2312967-Pyramimonas_sp.AAC.1
MPNLHLHPRPHPRTHLLLCSHCSYGAAAQAPPKPSDRGRGDEMAGEEGQGDEEARERGSREHKGGANHRKRMKRQPLR